MYGEGIGNGLVTCLGLGKGATSNHGPWVRGALTEALVGRPTAVPAASRPAARMLPPEAL